MVSRPDPIHEMTVFPLGVSQISDGLRGIINIYPPFFPQIPHLYTRKLWISHHFTYLFVDNLKLSIINII